MPFRNVFKFWGHKTHPKTTWHTSELHTVSNGQHKNSHGTGSNSHVTVMTSSGMSPTKNDVRSSMKRNVVGNTAGPAVGSGKGASTGGTEGPKSQPPSRPYENGVVDDHILVPKTEQPLRYCDDDDLGIMSEVDTSCTSGKTARRNGRHKPPSSSATPTQTCAATASTTTAASSAISVSNSASNLPGDSDKNANVVFLQYKSETKRAVVPAEGLHSLSDIRTLFLNTFYDSITPEYLNASHVKVYIQDPSNTELFYELDDVNDVKPRSILKLHEQSRPFSPVNYDGSLSSVHSDRAAAADKSATRFSQQNIRGASSGAILNDGVHRDPYANYYSESELDNEYRMRKNLTSGFCRSARYRGKTYSPSENFYRSSSARYGNVPQPPPKPQRSYLASPSFFTCDQDIPHANSPITQIDGRRSAFGFSEPPPEPDTRTQFDYLLERKSHGSDQSDSTSLSGSVTPVVDEQTKARMLSMEKQLASLSNLVHSALISKGVSDNIYRDLETLRREILDMGQDSSSESSSVARYANVEKSNIPKERMPAIIEQRDQSMLHFTPEARVTLQNVKVCMEELKAEQKRLRRIAELNAQSTLHYFSDVFDRIRFILNTKKIANMLPEDQNGAAKSLHSERCWVEQDEERFREKSRNLEDKLSAMERQIEALRRNATVYNKPVKMSDIAGFADNLVQIGRYVAALKGSFPTLQERLTTLMSAEMEKVVREEKFLKEEPPRINAMLKRCRKLSNTILALKKIYIVQNPQDPSMEDQEHLLRANDATSAVTSKVRPAIPDKPDVSRVQPTEGVSQTTQKMVQHVLETGATTGQEPKEQQSPKEPKTPDNVRVLDSLLEELQNVSKTATKGFPTEGELTNTTTIKRVGFADTVKQFSPVRDHLKSASPIAPDQTKQFSPIREPLGSVAKEKAATADAAQLRLATQQVNQIIRNLDLSTSERPATAMGTSYGYSSMRNPSPSFQHAMPFNERSRSVTPSSVTSEPGYIYRRFGNNPPPPPPRSSSRNLLTKDCKLFTGRKYNSFKITSKNTAVPRDGRSEAFVRTNAIDDATAMMKANAVAGGLNTRTENLVHQPFDVTASSTISTVLARH